MVMRIGARLEAGFDQNTYEIIEQYKTIQVRLGKVRLAGGERDRRGLKG